MNFEFRMLKWLLPFVLVLPAQAATFVATNIYSVAKDQVVAEELWIATGEAETEGTFKNDLFISSPGSYFMNRIHRFLQRSKRIPFCPGVMIASGMRDVKNNFI